MSKPLQTLVKGDMKEAREGVTEWPQIDEATFIRFWEFAYTGDYRAAEPSMDVSTPSTSTNSNANAPTRRYSNSRSYGEDIDISARRVVDSDSDMPGAGMFKREIKISKLSGGPPRGVPSRITRGTPKDEMWRQFQDQFNSNQDKVQTEQPNNNPLANYSEVLLSHARLYALADYYCVDALMALCLRKLHQMLAVFDLHGGARVADVAQLLDYSFENTGNKADGLRSMLATYAACKIEELWGNAYFQDVLESGEVAKAIIGQLMRRLQ